MSEVFGVVLGVALAFLVGYVVGLDDGRSRAARDCETVGAFYTRDLTFKCEVKK